MRPSACLVAAALLVAQGLFAWTGCQERLPPLGDAELERGRSLFRNQCKECHGVDGDGKGPSARFQQKPPRNFVAEGFRFKHARGGVREVSDDQVTDEDLFKTVSEGLPQGTMPAFAGVPEDQRRAMVKYVRHLHEKGRAKRKP
jgi:mono/diheme cytochrome c family protein